MPDSPQYQSPIPELKMPPNGFVSTIPQHLLVDIDAQMRWLLEEVSKNTAATEFACRGVVAATEHLRTLNGKTYRNEQTAASLVAELQTLKDQASTVSPFLKPVSMFATLWANRLFRWIFTLGLITLFGLIYPWYIGSPWVVIKAALGRLLGAE